MDQGIARLDEGLLLELGLEAHIAYMHGLSLDLVESLLNVGMLDPVPEGCLNTIELALLNVGKNLGKESIPISVEIDNFLPLFKSSCQVYSVEPCKFVGENPLGLS